jgi:hypothetical protein
MNPLIFSSLQFILSLAGSAITFSDKLSVEVWEILI